MSTKSNITSAVPTVAHAAAAQSLGRIASQMHQQIGAQLNDTAIALTQCIKDMSVGSPFTCTGATLAGGGAGYAVNEVLTLANGVQIKVLTVTAGAVATLSVLAAGSLSGALPPSNPASQISSTGGGRGATFNLTWTSADPNVATFLTALADVS
jgi:hypothetical protein